jgi:hypothetical protein
MLNDRIVPHKGGDLLHGDGLFIKRKIEGIASYLSPGIDTVTQIVFGRTIDDHEKNAVGHDKKHGEKNEVFVVLHVLKRVDGWSLETLILQSTV